MADDQVEVAMAAIRSLNPSLDDAFMMYAFMLGRKQGTFEAEQKQRIAATAASHRALTSEKPAQDQEASSNEEVEQQLALPSCETATAPIVQDIISADSSSTSNATPATPAAKAVTTPSKPVLESTRNDSAFSLPLPATTPSTASKIPVKDPAASSRNVKHSAPADDAGVKPIEKAVTSSTSTRNVSRRVLDAAKGLVFGTPTFATPSAKPTQPSGVKVAHPSSDTQISTATTSSPAVLTYSLLPLPLRDFAVETNEVTNRQINKHFSDMVTDNKDFLLLNAFRSGMKAGLSYHMLRLSSAKTPARGRPEFLIICVDNALCQEISNVFTKMSDACRAAKLRVTPVATLMAHMKDEATRTELSKNANIFVVTAGKLVDLLDRGQLDMSAVRKIVLDQADCLLIYDDDKDIANILRRLRPHHHVVAMSSRTSLKLEQRWKDETPASMIKLADMVRIKDHDARRVVQFLSLSKHITWEVQYCSASARSERLADYLMEEAPTSRQVLAIGNFKETIDAVYSFMRAEKDFKDKVVRHRAQLVDQDERYESIKKFGDGKARIMISTRRSIYGASFSFLPVLVLLDVPNSTDEFLYILQWYFAEYEKHATAMRAQKKSPVAPQIVVHFHPYNKNFLFVVQEFKDLGEHVELPKGVLKYLK